VRLSRQELAEAGKQVIVAVKYHTEVRKQVAEAEKHLADLEARPASLATLSLLASVCSCSQHHT
jgi:hypothetical protein